MSFDDAGVEVDAVCAALRSAACRFMATFAWYTPERRVGGANMLETARFLLARAVRDGP